MEGFNAVVGATSWVRLPGREKHVGRTSYWAFNAYARNDNLEDVPMWTRKDLAREIQDMIPSNHPSQKPGFTTWRSTNEEQTWTIFVNPVEIEGARVGFRQSHLRLLGLDILKHCAEYRSWFDVTVEIKFSSFEVRVVDHVMRDERRVDQCHAACQVLLSQWLRRRTTPDGTAFRLVSRTLWDLHKKSCRWDDVPQWLTASRAAKKRIKTL